MSSVCLTDSHTLVVVTLNYTCAMRCGRDMLWFRLLVCVYVTPEPCEQDRDYAVVCFLADILIIMRGQTVLILEVKGQGHNGHTWK